MGINLEYATLLVDLSKRNQLPMGGTVMELGAQEISADFSDISKHISRCGLANQMQSIATARDLYKVFNFDYYNCIDATAEHGAFVLDLNKSFKEDYNFLDQYDLVTDLGTFEHVFDIASAFRNAHDLCKVKGLMIHALPSNCNANHGYYVIQPRLISDIAVANDYEVLDFLFTVDYKPKLYKFTLENYRNYDDRDLMIYVVLRKNHSRDFLMPFDSIFTEKSKLDSYEAIKPSLVFSSYIKSTWKNVMPKNLSSVPVKFLTQSSYTRRLLKKFINYVGGLC